MWVLLVAFALQDDMDTSKDRDTYDGFGKMVVAAGKFWGAQTQRSLENFKISDDLMPIQVVYGLAMAKKAVTFASAEAIGEKRASAIRQAADEVLSGKLDAHFPLKVWQTGSGTQSNMNVNEVLAFRATQISGEPVHPNDHCNWGQSSNDVFPTAMHIAGYLFLKDRMLPALDDFIAAMEAKANEFKDIVKIGRTHLQDAVPLHLGDEFQTWAEQVKYAKGALRDSMKTLLRLPIGGTAVGTGLNAKLGFAEQVVAKLKTFTGDDWEVMAHKFENIASHDTFVNVHGSLNTLASAAMKIANDIRLLGSGPRSGLGELSLPANEPGSSIMPGKVNPTQSEALTMVAAQVMGNHVAVTVGGSNGHLQLNAFKPLIIFNVLKSAQLLSGAFDGFRTKCLVGIEANVDNIKQGVDNSLMLVTALNKKIGYDKAAKIAKTAHAKGQTLKETAMQEGVASDDFDAWVVPKKMALGPRAEL
jgi:fumarate hydratase class II